MRLFSLTPDRHPATTRGLLLGVIPSCFGCRDEAVLEGEEGHHQVSIEGGLAHRLANLVVYRR